MKFLSFELRNFIFFTFHYSAATKNRHMILQRMLTIDVKNKSQRNFSKTERRPKQTKYPQYSQAAQRQRQFNLIATN